MNEHISWSEHIKQLCSKVRKLIGMLYRQFYTWADTSTLITIYLTCIRPHLEYATHLWDPYNKKYIELLESVQKFACKVCHKCWDMDYQNLLHCLDIPPLSVRRRYLIKLITMFNIVNGQSFFPPGIFEPQSPSYNSRHSSSQNVCRPRSHTNYLQSSYVPSVIFAWNNLPNHYYLYVLLKIIYCITWLMTSISNMLFSFAFALYFLALYIYMFMA